MKTPWLLLFPLLCCLANCQEKKRPDVNSGDIVLSDNPRAAAAAKRVRPALESDLAEKGLRFGDPIFIRAFKEEKLLELFVLNHATSKYELFRTYPVAGTSGTLGPKLAEGDGQVPEGFYASSLRLLNPNSNYHLSFNIGYPNAFDTFHKRTGSHIMIHGSNVSIGCLAMTDAKIEEIYTLADAALRNGQPFFRVHIFPFRMTDQRMETASQSPHVEFWKNLKEGHDHFERTSQPPDASVGNGRYLFK